METAPGRPRERGVASGAACAPLVAIGIMALVGTAAWADRPRPDLLTEQFVRAKWSGPQGFLYFWSGENVTPPRGFSTDLGERGMIGDWRVTGGEVLFVPTDSSTAEDPFFEESAALWESDIVIDYLYYLKLSKSGTVLWREDVLQPDGVTRHFDGVPVTVTHRQGVTLRDDVPLYRRPDVRSERVQSLFTTMMPAGRPVTVSAATAGLPSDGSWLVVRLPSGYGENLSTLPEYVWCQAADVEADPAALAARPTRTAVVDDYGLSFVYPSDWLFDGWALQSPDGEALLSLGYHEGTADQLDLLNRDPADTEDIFRAGIAAGARGRRGSVAVDYARS